MNTQATFVQAERQTVTVSERETFEAVLAASMYGGNVRLISDHWDEAKGEYALFQHQVAWVSWQAARTVAAPSNQLTVYAFMHNDCVFESSAYPVSLHESKADAWRAMHRHQFAAWEKAQRECRLESKAFIRKHWGEDAKDFSRKDDSWRKAYVNATSFVREFVVIPANDKRALLPLRQDCFDTSGQRLTKANALPAALVNLGHHSEVSYPNDGAEVRALQATPSWLTSSGQVQTSDMRSHALLICAESAALCGNEREVGCPRCDAVLAMAAHFCFTAEDLSALFTPDHVAEGQRQEADGGATHLSKDM